MTRLAAALLLLGGAGVALAQDDLGFGEPASEEPSISLWSPFVEAVLRADRVDGLPAGREDLERVRARLRAGLRRDPGEDGWIAAFALEGGIGTGANKRSLANNDVEDVDGLGIDEAWIGHRRGSADSTLTRLVLGKARLPLQLTPMLWDDDLRPLGASAQFGGGLGAYQRWEVVLGAFEPDPLGADGARVGMLQLAWQMPLGDAGAFGARLGYLDWSGLDHFARAGLARGNLVSAGRFQNDYRLLDAQLWWRGLLAGKALEARLDRVRNLAADRARHGTRASLVYGDRFDPGQPGWEFGWAWQRIQRDAVVAAVTADDWWFHTAARGHMPWIGYGFDATWSMRLAAFFETRDGLDERTRRVLLDVEARW